MRHLFVWPERADVHITQMTHMARVAHLQREVGTKDVFLVTKFLAA